MANEIFSRFIGIRYLHVYTTIHTMETLQYTHLSAPSRSVSTHARSIFHETRTTSQFFPSIFDESSRNRSTIEDATTRMTRRRATWKIRSATFFVRLRGFCDHFRISVEAYVRVRRENRFRRLSSR